MRTVNRTHAWIQAKAAIRAYSRNPSETNAVIVENAWREIRRMDSLSFWREWQATTLSASGSAAPPHLDATEVR